jgi:hypothetical protein
MHTISEHVLAGRTATGSITPYDLSNESSHLPRRPWDTMLLHRFVVALTVIGGIMPPTATGQSPEPTPQATALSVRLVNAMGAGVESASPTVGSPPASGAGPSASLAALKEFRETYLTPELMKSIYAAEYARRFTPDELRELLAFYATPTGAKFAKAQLQMGEAIRSAVASVFAEHAVAFQEMLLKHTGHSPTR